MKLAIATGTTDYSLLVFIQDSSSTVGAGLTGLDDTKVDAYYCRMETDNDVVKADVGIADLTAITDAHSDGGFIEIDASNLPGWYRLDLPDSVLAAGAWTAGVRIYDAGSNDVADCVLEIQLTSPTRGLAGIALPDAAADAAGGLPVSDTGGLDMDAILDDTNELQAAYAAGNLTGGKYKTADTTGNWSTAGTWSDGVVPAAGENIIIATGVTVTVAADIDLEKFGTLELEGTGVLNIAVGVTVPVVPEGWIIATNSGTATTNYGTIITSAGVVTYNYGSIRNNTGTVANNYGMIVQNSTGTVTTNSGDVGHNGIGATIATNYWRVSYNIGTISINYGMLTLNGGTVTNNPAVIIANDGSTVTTNSGVTMFSFDATAPAGCNGDDSRGGFMGLHYFAYQTGDNYTRLGAPAGDSVSADIAVVVADTNELQEDWTDGGRLDLLLDAILADTAQLSGAGAIPWTVTVTVSGNPIDGAEVFVTSDAAGNTAVEGPKYTDASGEADFRLDAGTYYVWVSASGYSFTNPTELEVEVP